MKNIALITMTLLALGLTKVHGQTNYRTSVGLGIDFGTGETLVGPSAKYFFKQNQAALAEVVFGSGITGVTLLYQYHGRIASTNGLRWFAGAGPSFNFIGGGTTFSARPNVGLDYKIETIPLNFSFDWRPDLLISEDGGFQAARFGIGIRYVIN
ncbi:hypothetical protein [Cellulophaga sp. Hel_I_12]|uniref:hypothetical protein n=1 Tax=Cellulophaga sp. Hel_I_12 TaxID=1249972 RepID=UPI000648E8E1|nr:hypothetical protein [Cellulophaga sp. Hel_I_12]